MKRNILNPTIILNSLLLISTLLSFADAKRACDGANDCADIGQCFTGMTSKDSLNPITTPPDCMGAVGPEQFIIFVNNGIRSFNKKTGLPDGILDSDLVAFWSAGIIKRPVDVRVRYDQFSKKWFFIGMDTDIGNNLYISVADTSNSDGVITKCTHWNIFILPNPEIPDENGMSAPPETRMDFTTLGVDTHALYIGAETTTNEGKDNTLYVVQKKSLSTKSIKITAFRNLGLVPITVTSRGTLHGVDNFDSEPEFGYYIGSDREPTELNVLLFVRIANPGSEKPSRSPVIRVSVPEYGKVIFPPHKGNLGGFFGLLDTGKEGGRIWCGGHVRNGQLYTSHEPSVNAEGGPTDTDRDCIRWYQLDVTGDPTGQQQGDEALNTVPAVVKIGTIFDKGPFTDKTRFYQRSAIMTNQRGDIAIGATVSAEDEYINGIVFRRFKDDPVGEPILNGIPNSLSRDGIYITESQNSFNFEFGNFLVQRYGDYNYTSLDPSDEMTMWTVIEYTAETDIYGMKVAEVKAPAVVPPFPQACS